MDVPAYVRDYLASIALKLEFSSEANIDFDAGSNAGDGNLGSLIAVTISESNRLPVHLLCKMMVSDAETRETMKLDQLFKREVLFYEKVMPAFEKFQRAKGVRSFVSYPKCHGCLFDGTKDQYLIVMEDLRPRQYTMWPKNEPITLDHVLAVIRELAKFHALSFALKDQQPAVFDDLKDIDDLLIELLKQHSFVNYLKQSHDQILDVLRKFLPEHEHRFRSVWEETMPLVNRILDGRVWEPFAVFLHGDLWNNNILFHHAETADSRSTVNDVTFVDWQFLNYNSPALDLMFYIFSATDKQLRDNHYDEMIQCYYLSLADNVRALGSDPDILCPMDALIEHLKIFGSMTYLTFPSAIDVIFKDDKRELQTIQENYDIDKQQTGYERCVVGFAIDLMRFGYI